MFSLTAKPGTLRERNLDDLAEDDPEFLYLVVTVGLCLKHFSGILVILIADQTCVAGEERIIEYVVGGRIVNHCNNRVILPIILTVVVHTTISSAVISYGVDRMRK